MARTARRGGTGVRRWGLVPVLAALALACGDDPVAGPPPEVPGRYRLVAVNGSPPPVRIAAEPGLEVFADEGALDLFADGRFRQAIGYRSVSGGQATRSLSTLEGTYSVSGGRVELRSEFSGRTYAGTLAGGTLSYRATGDQLTLELTWSKESSLSRRP